jgi:hypothetical protein
MRIVNRLLATVIAVAVAAFSAVVAVEIVLGYYFGRGPWLLPWARWHQRSRELAWSDRSVVVTFVLIGVAGLVLVAFELWKRAPVALPLQDKSSDVHTAINRRSLEHALIRAALRVDGITGAQVRSRRNRVTVHAATQRRQAGDLRESVNANAASVLRELRLQNQPRLVVDVQSRRPTRGEV